MKDILKHGKIVPITSEQGGGGLTREVHLIRYNGKKYVLRKCATKERADLYEKLTKKFEKYGFLPKFLGRYKNNLFFEYLPGRDLREKDALKYSREIGRICGIVNREKLDMKGKFNYNRKFIKKIDFLLDKKVIDKEKYDFIAKKYKEIRRKINLKLGFDLGDVDPNNFRLSKGKIYFVDIEGLNIRLIGVGFAKPLLRWFKTSKQRQNFFRGYNSVISSKFINKDYLQFFYLYFLVNNTFSKYNNKRSYASNLRRINRLLNGEEL